MREPRRNRRALMLTDGEVAEIENVRFAKRIGTEAGAMRYLIRHGIEAINAKGPAAGATAPDQEPTTP